MTMGLDFLIHGQRDASFLPLSDKDCKDSKKGQTAALPVVGEALLPGRGVFAFDDRT